MEWFITKEKMKIGEFDCQKAEVNYGGRKWTAWFTTAIPISDGPYIFNQLPGIIIKIFDEDVEFTFDLVKVQKNNWPEFYEHKNTKEINWETFKKLQETYYEQPLLEVRLQNLPISRSDDDANTDRSTSQYRREIEQNIRQTVRENNNPIELNHKINYK